MKIVVAAVAIFVATAGFASSNNHPGNARAASACSTLFFDEGDLDEAKFFAQLAREEDFTIPESLTANAQISMHEGHWAFMALARRNIAGDVLLRGAAELLERGRLFDVRLAVMAATESDASLKPVARRWAYSVVRAKLTPRNAVEMLALLGVVADDTNFHLEIARRALAMHFPKLAVLSAQEALKFPNAPRREIALLLVDASRALHETSLKEEALKLAVEIDPTVSSYRPKPVQFIGGTCGNVTSPFAGPSDSDERFFPAATYAPPLPPRAIPADAKSRETQCRALAPPLFPEPFNARSSGRDAEERVWQPGDISITDTPPPCVNNSAFEVVVAVDGHVESVTVYRASFKAGGPNDPAAIAAEEKALVPVVMRQKYKPGRIRGVPIRSITRAAVSRNCE
jgi:hypothetical protein